MRWSVCWASLVSRGRVEGGLIWLFHTRAIRPSFSTAQHTHSAVSLQRSLDHARRRFRGEDFSHLVETRIKPSDGESFGEKRGGVRTCAHLGVVVRRAPCAYIVTLVPSKLRCSAAATKPGMWRMLVSVARLSNSTSRACSSGATVNTLMTVIGRSPFVILTIERVGMKPFADPR
jgi:hypothetical protein